MMAMTNTCPLRDLRGHRRPQTTGGRTDCKPRSRRPGKMQRSMCRIKYSLLSGFEALFGTRYQQSDLLDFLETL
ncbi:MAG: hypothetical protein QF792_07080, partial [Phycisphaerae bacterium]|nr:hypothetical protein [Phycisphaerae bacterium]